MELVCFVSMPIDADRESPGNRWSKLYSFGLKPLEQLFRQENEGDSLILTQADVTLSDLGLKVNIKKLIDKASFVIGVIINRLMYNERHEKVFLPDPEALWQLGYAEGKGKPIVFLADERSLKSLPPLMGQPNLCMFDRSLVENVNLEDAANALQRISKDLHPYVKYALRITQERLGISPMFSQPARSLKKNQCFYLCPFGAPFDEIYRDYVVPAVEAAGYTVNRGDEIFGTQPIISDIWEGINEAEVVLADVTGRNPNVMYEIGMAHTLGKPVLMITQTMDDVPFDLKHYRCVVYSFTPKGISDLTEKIVATLRSLSGGTGTA